MRILEGLQFGDASSFLQHDLVIRACREKRYQYGTHIVKYGIEVIVNGHLRCHTSS